MVERRRKLSYSMLYNEEVVVYFKTCEILKKPDVEQAIAQIETLVTHAKDRHLIADLSEASGKIIEKEARKVIKSCADDVTLDKFAVIGASLSVRMIDKVVLFLLGRSDSSKFFKTEAEVLTWLKGGI
ncbi:hypothetical protein JXM67_05870 [candidate division WOR-3 bacterium]|nr:hypothetical protein [candidate division WOR-3 bacterium]